MKTGTRFSREDWLELGLAQLAQEGSSGLTVEALCHVAGRTRGSFYHHFNDHDGFIDLLLNAWKQRNTVDIAEEILSQAPNLRAQHLSDLANHLDQDLERAVRRFAQSNKTAQEAVRDVDQLRTEFVIGLYVDAGLAADEARDIAQLEYAAFVGSQIIWPDMTAAQRVSLDKRFAGMVRKAFGLDGAE